jgi:hypothetical protein
MPTKSVSGINFWEFSRTLGGSLWRVLLRKKSLLVFNFFVILEDKESLELKRGRFLNTKRISDNCRKNWFKELRCDLH